MEMFKNFTYFHVVKVGKVTYVMSHCVVKIVILNKVIALGQENVDARLDFKVEIVKNV
jgi:hypothetical protein